MTKAEALARYAETMRGKAKAAEYTAIVRRWLVRDGRTSRQALTAYLTAMERGGMHPSSVDKHLRTLRRCFKVLGLAWPGCDWRWDRKTRPSSRYTAGPEFVGRLVRASWSPTVGRLARAWLLLSTLYGCRAAELAAWSQRDLGGSTVYVHRVKHGESRWYWLPPQVRPILVGVALRPAGRKEPYAAWRRLVEAAGVHAPGGKAWHLIRYGLVNGLRAAGVPDADVGRFLSWAGEDDAADMVRHYGSPTGWVDGDGVVRTVPPAPPDPRAGDAAVWRKHPFLGLWLTDGVQGTPPSGGCPAR